MKNIELRDWQDNPIYVSDIEARNMLHKEEINFIIGQTIEFMELYHKFKLEPHGSYYWIPIRQIKNNTEARPFIVMPSELTVPAPEKSLSEITQKSLQNVENILKVFSDYHPTRHLYLQDYNVSILTLVFEIPEHEDIYMFIDQIRQLSGNILTPCECDKLYNLERIYVIKFQV